MRLRALLVVTIATAVVATAFAIWADSLHPNSTPGVAVVGKNTVRLPEGQALILTHSWGKAADVWRITYDGASTVHVDEVDTLPFWGDHHTGRLCDGCRTDIGMGLGDHIYAWKSGDAVYVQWPWGWDYRPYKS